jgi:hypothetical protein
MRIVSPESPSCRGLKASYMKPEHRGADMHMDIYTKEKNKRAIDIE